MGYLDNSMHVLLFSANIFLLAVALLLHVIGLYLLFSIGRKVNLQHTILIHLGVFQVISCVSMTITCVILVVMERPFQTKLCMYLITFNDYTLPWIYKALMFCITLDRTLAIVMGFKYTVFSKTFRGHVHLSTCWIVCILLSLTLYFIDFWQEVKTANISLLATDIMLMAFAACTFCRIFCTIRQSKLDTKSAPLWKKQTFLLPGLIVATYLVFVGVSDGMMVVGKSNNISLHLGSNLLYTCGFVSDAGLYVLSQPRVKHEFMCQVGARRRSSSVNSTAIEAIRMRKCSIARRGTIDTVIWENGGAEKNNCGPPGLVVPFLKGCTHSQPDNFV